MTAMRCRPARPALLFLAVFASCAGCGREVATTTPLAPSVPLPRLLRIVDGWTGEAVIGAVVRTDTGLHLTTAADTRIDVSACRSMSIDAVRYLERRVYCNSQSLRTEAAISLWPIASALEMQETQRVLFREKRLARPSALPHYLSDDLMALPGSRDAWMAAAAEIGTLTADAWRVTLVAGVETLRDDDDAVVVMPATGRTCAFYSDPDPVFRYCYAFGRGPFIPYLIVEPSLAARRDLALRVLLGSLGFGVGQLPGLTSRHARTADLSDEERKMLRMVGLRPVPILWPDWEF